ncbi:MAG: DNA-processing protein DprA [Bdellovibrio bacteriovorus]
MSRQGGPGLASDIADWLALAAAPGLGPRTIGRLIAHFGDPGAARRAPAQALRELGLKPDAISALSSPDQAGIDRAMAWAEQPQASILTRSDPRYPPLLGEIPDAPPVLFVRGDPLLLAEPQIAIVGSRNPTPQGEQVTRELASRLAGWGLVVTSGLAAGVDGAAHQGALEAGRTIAVLGTGPDQVYPGSHRDLARRIAATGALVSEYPPGEGPRARNFPRRNRLISGLSLGTLVTEAALQSGSLITARHALEQGREVFAVPGSVRNPLARGCHALIREGARLVEDAEQVLAELAPLLRGLVAAPPAAGPEATATLPTPEAGSRLDADYQRLLAAMGFDAIALDELVHTTGLPVQDLSSMLLVLELEGHVSSAPGGRYCRNR